MNNRETGVTILNDILENGAYANISLNKALSGIVDRQEKSFITNLVYGTLNYLYPIDYQLNCFLKKPIKAKDILLKTILRAACFEMLFSSAKSYAVVNEYVKLGKRKGNQGWGNMINGILRNLSRQKDSLNWPDFSSATEKEAFFRSVPAWIVALWQKERGTETARKLILALDRKAVPVLRVNQLKTDSVSLKKILSEKGIEAMAGTISPVALKPDKGIDVSRLSCYQQGLCTVQEESSQLVALALNPQPDEKVLDMCAAPGGKTTHLAEHMQNRGKVIASDVYSHKIQLIENNVRRLGIENVTCIEKNAEEWGSVAPNEFDAILLDAPCSGLGVLNRRADSRFRKEVDDISALVEIQRKLLESAFKALKPGGRMVYSTCTLSKAENIDNIHWFLKQHPEMSFKPFTLQGLSEEDAASVQTGYLEVMPFRYDSDGFFIALLRKADTDD